MLQLNRDSVLKSFMQKVKEAKRLNMKDVKMTMKEIDDLFQVVYELMTEQITNALVKIEEMKEVKETKKTDVLPKKRRVIEEFKIDKEPVVEKKEEEIKQVQQPIQQIVVQQPPKVEQVPVNVIVEEEPEEEEEDNSLYGGTW